MYSSIPRHPVAYTAAVVFFSHCLFFRLTSFLRFLPLPFAPHSPLPQYRGKTSDQQKNLYCSFLLFASHSSTPFSSLMREDSQRAQVAINGFIGSILIVVGSIVYVLWSVLPDEVLHRMHMTYYPDRYWAVAVPAILVMFLVHYFTTSWLLVLVTTHPLTDGRCITDEDSKPDTEIEVGALADSGSSLPPWVDIPVSVASHLLFEPWNKKV
ncbi:putative PIG-P [Leishmania shawi]|uniref:PIG-P n=2 Tax=Leishmania guyanensis species complex TaxID=38579 RepID=A0AAW3B8Z8_9TRYP